jgi:hypothetical protein
MLLLLLLLPVLEKTERIRIHSPSLSFISKKNCELSVKFKTFSEPDLDPLTGENARYIS